jgi:PKD repeat protein
MRLALAACAVFLCASCVKRIAPSAGGARTVGSGVPQRFGSPQNLPRDTSITWDFGDGTPQQSGPEAVHAFPRAGNFTVTETVRAGGGVRTDSARITVLRRSVPMAVPADVRGVFLAQQPWTRAKAARAAARRIGLGDFFDETVGAVNDAVGFDTTDAQAVAENGIDPDEGVALYTVPQDPEALVLCIGISDLPRAEAALRKLLTAGAEPFALTEAKLPGGARAVVGTAAQGTLRIGYLERFGYLYLRARGSTDPLLALASAAAVPEAGGLERDGSYQTALKQVGPGDALFYSAASRDGAAEDRRGFLSGQLVASAFSVGLGKDGLQLRLFGQLRNLNGQGLQELLSPLKPPPDLAAQLPGGAAAYLKLSGEPQRTWTELLRALGPDAAQARERAREFLGAEPEASFLPLFTGNAGVGVYVDAASLLEAFLGEQVSSLDKSTFIAAAEVREGKDAELRALLDKLGRGGQPPLAVRGAMLWKLSEVLQVAQRPGWLYVALGGGAQHEEPAPPAVDRPAPRAKARKPAKSRPQPPREPTPAQLGPLAAVLLADPAARTLGAELASAHLRGFEVPQAQLAWLDVQGVLRSLERAADDQGGMVATGVHVLAGRVRGVRDALFEARPSPDGLGATLTIRYVERGAGQGVGR